MTHKTAPPDKTATKTDSAPKTGAAPQGENALQAKETSVPAERSSEGDVADFISKMKTMTPVGAEGRGRLVFAMDSTMSRAPTWDMALKLQGDMFEAVKEVGGLDVQLVYFRGQGECRASRWVADPAALARLMTSVACHGGLTQIRKVLTHTLGESGKRRVNALVYVGDSMEESVDELCARAGELALIGVPVFLFQEGSDVKAEQAFREIARLTKGAWCRFDPGSARQLRDLLTAVAVYAAGGRKALLKLSGGSGGAGARQLLEQLGPAGR
jgi:hypothetical protein